MSSRPLPAGARVALLSLALLPTSLVLAFGAVALVGRAAPAVQEVGGQPLFLGVVASAAAAGGAAWGRAVAGTRRAAAGAALGYGATVPLAMWALSAAESALLVRAQSGGTFSMPLAFGALFVAATFAVVFGAVLGLGAGSGTWRRAGMCALAGAAAFAAVDGAMDAAGWRVGAPDAEARFTMLVVLGAGLLAATACGGAVLGGSIARTNQK